MREGSTIVRLNVAHYRALLRLSLDDDQRKRVSELLAECEAQLQVDEPEARSEGTVGFR